MELNAREKKLVSDYSFIKKRGGWWQLDISHPFLSKCHISLENGYITVWCREPMVNGRKTEHVMLIHRKATKKNLHNIFHWLDSANVYSPF